MDHFAMGFKVKPFGVMLGLLGCIMIVLSLHKFILNGSCGSYGYAACPDALTPYFIMLPVGIISCVVAIFFGGGMFGFLGIFASVGIGALWAAFESDDSSTQSFGFVFGGIFAATPLLIVLLGVGSMGGMRKKAQVANRLIATGGRGVGTVTSVQDTGMTINDNPRVEITMRIEPEDRSAPFDATKTVTVSRVAIPRAGDRFPVWYDRNDPTQWAYGTDMDPAQAAPEIQAAFARASAGAPNLMMPTSPGAASVDKLTKLSELHASGALTDAEFAAAKARVIGGSV
jgi:hypothetical protein